MSLFIVTEYERAKKAEAKDHCPTSRGGGRRAATKAPLRVCCENRDGKGIRTPALWRPGVVVGLCIAKSSSDRYAIGVVCCR